jgi:hypothetical protein
MAMTLIKVPPAGQMLGLLGIPVDDQSITTIAALVGLSYFFFLLSHLALKMRRD